MRKYTFIYGIFHWFIHYFLVVMLVTFSGIEIFPVYLPFTLFGIYFKNNIIDHAIFILITSFIDLDHLPVLKKFGAKRVLFAQKRLVSPLHNFFFLSVTALISGFSALFISKVIAVLFFSLALHMIWDIFEDVVIFKTSFRRWERTWGLNTKELEQSYNDFVNEFVQTTPTESKNESKMGLKFSLAHILAHVLIAVGVSVVFNLNLFYFFLVLIISAAIDLDHLPLLIKHGFRYWYKISWVSQKQQSYPLHNFLVIFISFLGSFLIYQNLFWGIIFLAIFLHLLWDFFEDVFILKMGLNHWKIKWK